MAAFVGLDQNVAGGAVTATTTRMMVEGKAVLRRTDPVASHGTGLHADATMDEASARLIVGGLGVCRNGDKATCGHALVATATKARAA